MTKEEQGAADAKRRADEEATAKVLADAASNIDKSLAKLDDFSKRMDAFSKRMDDDDKRRDDDARRKRADDDAKRCADDDDDAKFKARMDAEEAEEVAERKAKGEPEETAADAVKRHRADKEKWRMDRRARADDAKRKADADKAEEEKEKELADKKKADEEAARKKADDDAAKKRADSIAAESRQIANILANLPKPATDADYAEMAEVQARADAAYQALGQRAPGPLQGEGKLAYRVRLLRGLQKYSKPWSGVELHTLQEAALDIADAQIRADAVTASRAGDDLPEDALLPVTQTMPGGHQVTNFRGRRTIFRSFAQPPMFVTKFLTERRA
jgi:hypothetical protein